MLTFLTRWLFWGVRPRTGGRRPRPARHDPGDDRCAHHKISEPRQLGAYCGACRHIHPPPGGGGVHRR